MSLILPPSASARKTCAPSPPVAVAETAGFFPSGEIALSLLQSNLEGMASSLGSAVPSFASVNLYICPPELESRYVPSGDQLGASQIESAVYTRCEEPSCRS